MKWPALTEKRDQFFVLMIVSIWSPIAAYDKDWWVCIALAVLSTILWISQFWVDYLKERIREIEAGGNHEQ